MRIAWTATGGWLSPHCGFAAYKKSLGLSSASYKDLPRLNLVLGLMTLRANRLDREPVYTGIIKRMGGQGGKYGRELPSLNIGD